MAKHVPVECHCNHSGCSLCDGGLFLCAVCGNLEGSLPTACPGIRCYATHGDAIYAGLIDFRDGAWLSLAPGFPAEALVQASPAERVSICQRWAALAEPGADRAAAKRGLRIATWKENTSQPHSTAWAVRPERGGDTPTGGDHDLTKHPGRAGPLLGGREPPPRTVLSNPEPRNRRNPGSEERVGPGHLHPSLPGVAQRNSVRPPPPYRGGGDPAPVRRPAGGAVQHPSGAPDRPDPASVMGCHMRPTHTSHHHSDRSRSRVRPPSRDRSSGRSSDSRCPSAR